MPDPISDALVGLTPEEQADYKASAIADLVGGDDAPEQMLEWAAGDVTIAIQGAAYEGGLLALEVLAWDANGDLPAPDYTSGERFLFRNPPILVWTTPPDEEGMGGVTTEDLTATFQGYVTDAVLSYARNHGWSG